MKKLLILSGKGGTGKTTTAAAFIHFSKAKAFADCDVDAPNLHLIANQQTTPQKTDFIGSKKAQLNQQECINCHKCIEHCRFDAIQIDKEKVYINPISCEGCGVCEYICPTHAIHLENDISGEQYLYQSEQIFSTAKLKMGRGNSGKLVTAVKKTLFKNAPSCELAIIDGSPGIGCPVIASINGVDFLLIVAEASSSGLSDLSRLVKTAQTFQTPMAICINKYTNNSIYTQKIEEFCQDNAIPFVGKIPYDPKVSIALNQGKSIAEIECPAKNALFTIYQNVLQKIQQITIL